jgi:hypothetical protein
MYHLGDEQKESWWLQFRDTISPHQQEHQQDLDQSSAFVMMVNHRFEQVNKTVS